MFYMNVYLLSTIYVHVSPIMYMCLVYVIYICALCLCLLYVIYTCYGLYLVLKEVLLAIILVYGSILYCVLPYMACIPFKIGPLLHINTTIDPQNGPIKFDTGTPYINTLPTYKHYWRPPKWTLIFGTGTPYTYIQADILHI